MRGYSAIGLHNPKTPMNVGSVLRLIGNYDSSLLVSQGIRYQRSPTDTMKIYRHKPFIEGVSDLFECVPFDCIPIAIDCGDFPTVNLKDFKHPERAFYIFGSEDNGLPEKIRTRCKFTVSIPTIGSMNLAQSVAVVLYDRMVKS